MPARSDVLYRIEREKNTVSESGKRYRPRSSRSDSKKRLIFDIDFENIECSCPNNEVQFTWYTTCSDKSVFLDFSGLIKWSLCMI